MLRKQGKYGIQYTQGLVSVEDYNKYQGFSPFAVVFWSTFLTFR